MFVFCNLGSANLLNIFIHFIILEALLLQLNKLQHIVNISSKVICLKQFTTLYEKQVLQYANQNINNITHMLHDEYILLPS